MEKSEEKRALEAKFAEIAKEKAAREIEMYLLGFQSGLMAASKAEADDREKEPA